MHVFCEVPLIEESNYSQPKLSPHLWVLWQPDVTSVVIGIQGDVLQRQRGIACKPAHLSLSPAFFVGGKGVVLQDDPVNAESMP